MEPLVKLLMTEYKMPKDQAVKYAQDFHSKVVVGKTGVPGPAGEPVDGVSGDVERLNNLKSKFDAYTSIAQKKTAGLPLDQREESIYRLVTQKHNELTNKLQLEMEDAEVRNVGASVGPQREISVSELPPEERAGYRQKLYQLDKAAYQARHYPPEAGPQREISISGLPPGERLGYRQKLHQLDKAAYQARHHPPVRVPQQINLPDMGMFDAARPTFLNLPDMNMFSEPNIPAMAPPADPRALMGNLEYQDYLERMLARRQ